MMPYLILKLLNVKNKITLSGFAGTGKSTIGKHIAGKLSFEFISVGDFSRQFVKGNYKIVNR